MLFLTPGEPAGIGPDLIIALAQEARSISIVVVADPDMLMQRAALLGLPLKIDDNLANPSSAAGELTVAPVKLASAVIPGTLNPKNAEYVVNTLKMATTLCQEHPHSGIVTAPVHKGVINDAGIAFSGHTELFAELTHTKQVVMMLATESLRVALATTHLPLKDVSAAITKPSLTRTIEILHHDMQHKFGIGNPHILIAGLNPHAGESGHLGMEEIETITPVIQALQAKGMHLTGPLPADTLYTPKYLETADATLAMYHDQGLPVLKYAGFGNAVNITLGLPIIRTSVDHGTALDLAGSGKANGGSLNTAIRVAQQCIYSMAP